MTINSEDTHDEYLRELYDDGTGGLADESTVSSRIASDMAQFGTVYTDTGDIPSTATVREAGTFDDPYLMMQYLQAGGLAAADSNGDVVPLGFVYTWEHFDETLYETVYTVYIDEDTG